MPGLVVLQCELPLATGVKEILFSVALVEVDDPRRGLGQITVTP
jgi:hypothetical protein